MRLKIKEHTEILKRNVFGKPIKFGKTYTIDRVNWLGRRLGTVVVIGYPNCVKDLGWKILRMDSVEVYFSWSGSTQFRTKEEAECVLKDMGKNPNKYELLLWK